MHWVGPHATANRRAAIGKLGLARVEAGCHPADDERLLVLSCRQQALQPSGQELVGAGLVIGAILFLTLPPLAEKRRGG